MVRKLVLIGLVAASLWILMSPASAMPMFARKEGLSCNACHTPFPRLNKFGYEYRAAGFRLPDTIGQKEEKKTINVGDYLSARIKTDIQWARSDDEKAGTTTNMTDFEFKEVTFYPITGSFLGNWASEVELSFPPGEDVETENAYMKRTSLVGKQGGFWTARLGVFHPFEGYGASDRPIGLARPLIQTTKPTGSPFKVWGFDQSGLELGYSQKDTRVTATVFNGLSPDDEPNQTKDTDNAKDLQIFVNQFLGKEKGGIAPAISAYYYRGKAEVTGGNDLFDRWALYANVPLATGRKGSILEILGGYAQGKDELPGGTFHNRGGFAELRMPLRPDLWGTVRYDAFDPRTSAVHNDINAVTAGVNWQMAEWVQLLGEYQHKTTQEGAGFGNKTDDRVTAEVVVIF